MRIKRDESRFTNSEILQVSANWQKIALDNNATFKLEKIARSTRTMFEVAANQKPKNDLYWNLMCHELTFPYKSGRITIVAKETAFPRLTYKFNHNSQFQLNIWKEDYLDTIMKYFGQKEISLGIKEFDSRFFIRTNDEIKARLLLNSQIQDYLMKFDITIFKIEDSTLEIGGLIDELNTQCIQEFINIAKLVVDSVSKK